MYLKVEYPHNVHLIRGNHEAADINALFGFRIECIERLVSLNVRFIALFYFKQIPYINVFLNRARERGFMFGDESISCLTGCP